MGIWADISQRWAERRAKKEVKKDLKELGKDFADDAVIVVAGDEEMPLSDFLAAEVAMYESFPDMTIDVTEDGIDDGVGDGVCTMDAVVSGTFTGADYVVGDKGEAIVATGQAVSKETTFTFTYANNLIEKLVIVGYDPISLYEEVAVGDTTSS